MKITNFQVERNPLATFDIELGDGTLLRNFEICRNDSGEIYVRTPRIRMHKGDGTWRFEFVVLLAQESRRKIFSEALSIWRATAEAMTHHREKENGTS